MHQNVDWSLKSGLECSFDREGLLASGSGDNTIKLWNVAGVCFKTLTGHGA